MPTKPTAEERNTPRQMLALIALAPAPTPDSIVIDNERGILNISLASLADGVAWVAHLGGKVVAPAEHGGRRWLRSTDLPHWHGWFVSLTASEDLPTVDTLDADTAAQLRAVAEGGEPE